MPAPPLRRLAFGLGGAILAAVVVVGGLILAFLFNFYHFAPKASYSAPKSALEAQRQDLDYFAKAMAFDRVFAGRARGSRSARQRSQGHARGAAVAEIAGRADAGDGFSR